jgi:hypothetical protein
LISPTLLVREYDEPNRSCACYNHGAPGEGYPRLKFLRVPRELSDRIRLRRLAQACDSADRFVHPVGQPAA